MEQTPQKAPLACYGLEHDPHDPVCKKCPHTKSCAEFTGCREGKVPLNRVRFDITPDVYRLSVVEPTDPEFPQMQRLYHDCFGSVYEANPTDNVSLHKDEIAANARKANCSIRLFMLANMVAHAAHEKEVLRHTDRARATSFRVKLLTGKLAVSRAKDYKDMCQKLYGTFVLSSLSALSGEKVVDHENAMLNSEVQAGCWVVRNKIRYALPMDDVLLAFYESDEIQLDPHWLALEASYVRLVLEPYIKGGKKTGTQAQLHHRHNTWQAHAHYKNHPRDARHAWVMRHTILREAVKRVVNTFNYQPDDFMVDTVPVKDMMEFWRLLALAVRQNHCLKFIAGEPSFFTARRGLADEQRS